MPTELSTSLQAKLLKHQELNQRLTQYTAEWGPVVQESKYWNIGFIHSYNLYRFIHPSTCFEPLAEHGWIQGWLGFVLRRRLLGFAVGI